MSVFAFRNGPSFRGADPTEQMQAAMDMPMSLTATLGDQFKGGILDSLGLGTAVRQATLPDEAPTAPTLTMQGPDGETITLPDTPQMRRRATVQGIDLQRETQQQLDQRRESAGALDQDQFKASPYFREGVRWDAGMTEDRASALAEAYDAKRVREHFATKRPIASFIGNLAGQAIDPINYIPVAGPTLRAANVARFGRVAGAALTGSIDAALNTAGASAVTFDTRKSMGDDITWQSTVTDIAMSAMIGGVFGTFGGLVESRRAGRLADSQKQATERLATLKNVQDARIALNGAIDGLARGEEVALPANAVISVERMAGSQAIDSPKSAQIDRSISPTGDTRTAAVTPADEFEKMMRDREYDISGMADDELQRVISGASEKTEAMILTAQDLRLEINNREALLALPPTKTVGFDGTPVLEVASPDGTYRGRGKLDESMAKIGHEGYTVKERAAIISDLDAKVSRLQNMIRDGEPAPERMAVVSQARSIRRPRPAVDASTARPEAPPMGRIEAETRIASPENFKAMSEQYRVNADDGSFIEQADVDQVRKEGRLTEDDEAALADAQQAFDNGSAYAEALKSVAGCLI